MDPAERALLLSKVEQYFLEFLTSFRERREDGTLEPDYYYVEQAKNMVNEHKRTLYVRMTHLGQIDPKDVSYEPSDFHNVIESKYMIVREALNSAVPRLLAKLEGEAIEEEVRKARETDELKFTAAFFDIPTYSGIRDLRTEKLGTLMTICGTVTRTTEVKPELLVGTFQCNLCMRIVSGVAQQFKITHPAICPAKHCGNHSSWTMLGDNPTTRWGDWQRLRIQENENEVPPGAMPRSMDVIVRDDMCDACKPGDKVMITGSLIVVPDVPTLMNPAELKTSVKRSLNTRSDGQDGVRGLKGLGQRDLTYKLAFYGGFIEEDSDWGSHGMKANNVRSEERLYITQADKDRYLKISTHLGAGGRKDCFDVLARNIAPSVQGHIDVKKGVLLMLLGGVMKRTDEGIKLRGDINVCLIGDPATAKSSILKWVSQFLPRAVFTSGKTSTAAGLTASVVKDPDMDGEKVIEPGALMLADNGICCIDEFERMDEKDQVAIHEAMEQQTITLSKAGIQATLNARASILASVLPKDTYYQPTLPLHKNVELSPPIMSRFDLMFVIQDIHDVTADSAVADHILAGHLGKQSVEGSLSQTDLQRYIRLARSCKPKLSRDAREKLVKCYKRLREDRGYVRGACGVTVRQLESLMRLSEAIARVHLDDIVRVEYVQEAFALQMGSIKRPERDNIDLDPDAPAAGAADEPAADEAAAPDDDAPAPKPARKKTKITFAEYQRIGQMLAGHLADREEVDEEVKEEDLIAWYMEQVEESIETEAQLYDHQHQIQLIINRLIDKDRVIVVARPSDDPMKPEGRVLVKHPNFPVGEAIGGAGGKRGA